MTVSPFRFTVFFVLSCIVSLQVITACDQLGVEQPSVTSGRLRPTVDHSKITQGCKDCHEQDRAPAVANLTHGDGGDCSTCHLHSETAPWKTLVASYSHTPTPENCAKCHEPERKPAPHPTTGDCGGCHAYNVWKNLTSFSHDPMPKTCKDCHEKDRPKADHDKTGECVGCHYYPSWSNYVTFNHYDPEPGDCNVCHEKDRPEDPHPGDGACKTCHTFPKFADAKYSHDPKPDQCGDYCHVRPTDAYSRAYPNQGPPDGFSEGDAGSGHLLGKDCVECHLTPPEGASTWGFDHVKPKFEFCLPCHFNQGNSKHGSAGAPTYELEGFGNCFNCHKNFDKNAERNWDL